MNPSPYRVGLLGGTFDPVHNAHLRIAGIAKEFCDLTEVWFIPSAVPPHKNCQAIADFNHRSAMVQLALAGHPDFKLSTIEADLPEPSYTIDTLRYFYSHAEMDTDFFFIIGADAFLSITTWKSYRQVLQSAHLVVIDRMGSDEGDITNLLGQLGYESRGRLSRSWLHPGSKKLILLPHVPSGVESEISSSLVRQKIMDNRSIEGLVPTSVMEYIQTRNLYE